MSAAPELLPQEPTPGALAENRYIKAYLADGGSELTIHINDWNVASCWRKAYAEAVVEGLNRLDKAARRGGLRALQLCEAVAATAYPNPKKAEPELVPDEPKSGKRVKHRY